MLDRIVVPLDGSQLSHAALPLARGLAARTGAAITLLSVMDPPRDFYLVAQDSSQSRLRPKDVDRLANEDARLHDYLNRMAATFTDVRVTTEVRLGSPVEEILEAAEAVPNSLVAMASHGRTGLGRALLGSVASRVVQGTDLPVVIVRALENSQDEYGSIDTSRVLVPLDGSFLAEQALAAVIRIFGTATRIHLVRAVEPVSPGHAYAPQTVAEYERAGRENAEQYLKRIAEERQDAGSEVTWEVRGDLPARGIATAAEELGVDMIAMTTHGRSGIGRFVLGSVAERVLHDANRPVMMIRATESAQTPDDEAPPLV